MASIALICRAFRFLHLRVHVIIRSQFAQFSREFWHVARFAWQNSDGLEDHPERVGYLLKDRVFDIAVLVDALRRLGEGESVVDPTIVTQLLGRRRAASPLDDLTVREREVLELLAEGLSNHAIAQRIVVAERTVEAHVKQIFQKLDLTASPDSHRRILAVLAYLRG